MYFVQHAEKLSLFVFSVSGVLMLVVNHASYRRLRKLIKKLLQELNACKDFFFEIFYSCNLELHIENPTGNRIKNASRNLAGNSSMILTGSFSRKPNLFFSLGNPLGINLKISPLFSLEFLSKSYRTSLGFPQTFSLSIPQGFLVEIMLGIPLEIPRGICLGISRFIPLDAFHGTLVGISQMVSPETLPEISLGIPQNSYKNSTRSSTRLLGKGGTGQNLQFTQICKIMYGQKYKLKSY